MSKLSIHVHKQKAQGIKNLQGIDFPLKPSGRVSHAGGKRQTNAKCSEKKLEYANYFHQLWAISHIATHTTILLNFQNSFETHFLSAITFSF